MVLFGIYLTIRSRALFNILRGAYPQTPFQWRRVWGAYFAAYGVNNFMPVGAGNLVSWFLIKHSIPGSRYPTVVAAFVCEAVFDCVMAVLVLGFAFTQAVFPKPSEFSQLGAFDLSFFAAHPDVLAFCATVLFVGGLTLFAVFSVRVRAFWGRVRQGLAIMQTPGRYIRSVFLIQLVAWFFRLGAFWLLLDAFSVGGSVQRVLLVLASLIFSAVMPLTPGGAGVQQALLLAALAGAASDTAVAAFAVGQEAAIATFTVAIGFVALVTIFRLRSFQEVIRRGREDREADMLMR